MGTLGTYLISAREAMGLDLHDSAQQTRISIHYLKALEEEDFSKLPGEVFVKGFLKNYARFLNLPEAEVMSRYRELRPQPKTPEEVESPGRDSSARCEHKKPAETPLEPVIWGSVIFVAVVIFLFASQPGNHADTEGQPDVTGFTGSQHHVIAVNKEKSKAKREALYLKIIALDDVWLLVRTDTSPQKKAVLKKGESITWSAQKRFLLSYGDVGALKLLLNEKELSVTGPKGAVVRDLMVTSAGITSKKFRVDRTRAVPKRSTKKLKPKPVREESRPQSVPVQPESTLQSSPTPADVPESAPPLPAEE